MQFEAHGTTIQVNTPDITALEQAVCARLRAREGFALATINLDHLDKLDASADFRRAYAAQDIVVADGNPIVWLSRLAGRPVRLLPGSDLVLPLAHWAAEAGVPVALVGSTDLALAGAAAHLQDEVPGLTIAAKIAPPMGFEPDGDSGTKALSALRASGAGLAFLALGAPKQELFAARGRRELPQMGFASIGAGLDFLAGTQARAPRWVRALAMEWLWRAATNPRRLGPRYLRSLLHLPGRAMRAFAQRAQVQR